MPRGAVSFLGMPGRERASGAGARARARGDQGTKDGVEDLFQLVVAYAKQETLDPVVKQAKTLAKGIAGATLMAFGTALLAVGFLRALQSEFGGSGQGGPAVATLGNAATPGSGFHYYPYGAGAHLSGDWSWVPYMGASLLAILVAVICVFRFLRGGPTR